jgi:glycosyltransferase involved in cell wall biosynthesis
MGVRINMRIVFLVSLFPPKWLAGTEIATYNIAKHLARRGHEVHIITRHDEGLPKEALEEGFCIHRISIPKIKFVRLYVLKELLLIKRLNPDIVHAQSIWRGLACVLAKKLFRIPYVVWGRGSDVYLPWRFKGPISKLVLNNANALIALTEHMKRKMCELLGRERSDVFVIPNGIDLDHFDGHAKGITQNSLKSRDEKVVLYVGRLEPVKGVKYLVKAMKILRDGGLRNVKLLIVGDGTERRLLEELVRKYDLEDCVVFAGKVPHNEIPAFMASADMFVLPSLSEGFPGVALEAMAMGLPVVATKVGGLPEIIKDGENGFLVEPRNPAEIAEKCALLLTDDELRARISRNNREKAKNYSWERVVEKLEEVYLTCLMGMKAKKG